MIKLKFYSDVDLRLWKDYNENNLKRVSKMERRRGKRAFFERKRVGTEIAVIISIRKTQERREPILNRTKKEWKTTQQTKKLPGGVYLFPAFW